MLKSIKAKFFLLFGLIAVFIFFAFLSLSYVAKKAMVFENGEKDVDQSEDYFNSIKEQDIRMIKSALKVFSENRVPKEIFVNKDREKLFEYVSPLFNELRKEFGITHFYFHDLENKTFLRVHSKDIYGDIVNRLTFKNARDGMMNTSGIELGKTAFALRVVEPYYLDNQLIGYVEMGQEIDHFIRFIKEKRNSDLVVFVKKDFLNRDDWKSVRKNLNLRDNWDDFSDYIEIDSTIDVSSFSQEMKRNCIQNNKIDEIMKSGKLQFFGGYDEKGKYYGCGAFPIRDASEKIVGSVFVISDFTYIKQDAEIASANMFFAYLILILISFLIYIFFINRIFINPIKKINIATALISNGNFKQRIDFNSKDEFGLLSKNFNKMADSLEGLYLNLDEKVKERTDKIEKLNKYMVGREMKMVELKKKIKDLENKISNNK